ncbi:oxygenase MpaB family protein [Dietzia alimentaria]|uniref:oxygenase MpaB family protein n=1 Tax=Dietzia alimentaria TaxID=665550 RepID=UPI00029B5701|nr:oxygenase MpaB family protein [Dietzia alimentaria]
MTATASSATAFGDDAPDPSRERTTTTRPATAGRPPVPGVFGLIPANMITDPAEEHPLTARVPLRPGRWYWRDLIATLDPVRDAAEIHRITFAYEFPWDYQRALELALYRTYCIPSVSAVLEEAGQFRDHPQKRYDDTGLLMSELIEHGYDSPRGKEALRVINRQHARYEITNDDMLYVLSTFIYEPLEWIDSIGWRRLHPNERLAAFHFYRAVGERMRIKDIPENIGEFRRWRDDYEARTMRYDRNNELIGTYTLDLMCSWYPEAVRPAVRKVVLSLVDDDMTRAFGFPWQPPARRKAAFGALRARSKLVRWLPVRRRELGARAIENQTYPGYPTGYRPADLGACPIQPRDRTNSCPIPHEEAR